MSYYCYICDHNFSSAEDTFSCVCGNRITVSECSCWPGETRGEVNYADEENIDGGDRRPDRAGYWWFVDDCGDSRIFDVTGDGDDFAKREATEFERHPSFDRWLGPAVPPDNSAMRQRIRDDYTSGIDRSTDECETCRWDGKNVYQEPCSSCYRLVFSEWQPKD